MSDELELRDPQRDTAYRCTIGKVLLIGREDPDDPSARPDVPCGDKHVSRRHCEVTGQADGLLRIIDLSAYGTFVNGEKLPRGEAVFVRAGDRLVLGHQYVLEVAGVFDTDIDAPTRIDPMNATPLTPTSPPPYLAQSGDTPGLSPTSAGPQTARPYGEKPPRPPAALEPPPQPEPKHPSIGQRYRIIRKIARGGMGVVYLGHDDLEDRPCAIKVLLAGGKASPDLVERFRRESKLAARLGQHPGIVRVFDLGTIPDSGVLFCAMEFVEGESLHKTIKRGLLRTDAVRMLRDLGRAVAYAHKEGVIHRDLKPQNVLVTPKGDIRLTDFGIAKALNEGSGLTAMGVAMGTPAFMAPEQIADSRNVTPRSDLYALGGILYFALTSKLAFKGKQVTEILRKVQTGDYRPPREIDPSIDPELEDLCQRTMAVNPATRPESADAFSDELEAWLSKQRPG